MKSALALIGSIALAAATPALAAPKTAAGEAPKCFMTQDLRGHTIGDERTLYLNVGGRSVWRAEMSNNCFGGAGPTDPITLEQRGASSRICGAQDLNVGATLNGGGLSSRCIVERLVRLTPTEAAALPRGMKP